MTNSGAPPKVREVAKNATQNSRRIQKEKGINDTLIHEQDILIFCSAFLEKSDQKSRENREPIRFVLSEGLREDPGDSSEGKIKQ